MWVLEDEESDLQATAFFLAGYGLVTCAHCVGTKPFIYNPTNPALKVSVSLETRSDELDLAILKVSGDLQTVFMELPAQSFESLARRGDEIMLLGFPDHAPGKELSVKTGQVQSFTTKSGIRRFNVSALIIAGNSGGPVLNRYKRVIGVAVTGADNQKSATQTEEHGVIPIGTLAFLL